MDGTRQQGGALESVGDGGMFGEGRAGSESGERDVQQQGGEQGLLRARRYPIPAGRRARAIISPDHASSQSEASESTSGGSLASLVARAPGIRNIIPNQGERGRRRAERLRIYDNHESQNSDYIATPVQDQSLRESNMPQFLDVLTGALWRLSVTQGSPGTPDIDPCLQSQVSRTAIYAWCVVLLNLIKFLVCLVVGLLTIARFPYAGCIEDWHLFLSQLEGWSRYIPVSAVPIDWTQDWAVLFYSLFWLY